MGFALFLNKEQFSSFTIVNPKPYKYVLFVEWGEGFFFPLTFFFQFWHIKNLAFSSKTKEKLVKFKLET